MRITKELLMISKKKISAAIANIYAQVVPVKRGLNCTYFMPFQKVLPVCANDVIEIEKDHFSAAVTHIYAQLVLMNRESTSTCIMLL